MKFHPSALKTEEDLKKLIALMKTYFMAGGKHVQFNVVEISWFYWKARKNRRNTAIL